MILYHGSYLAVEHPDVLHSRKNVDFGSGFYTTCLRTQAERWCRRFIQTGKEGVLSVYEFDDSQLSRYRFLNFPAYNGEWLDIVLACRDGLEITDYDIIQGGVSNDNVFNTCELLRRGFITRETALERLQYEKPNHQLGFKTQKPMDDLLQFIRSERL